MTRVHQLVAFVLISLAGYGYLATPVRHENSLPENVIRVIDYFDSSRIREFDSVEFKLKNNDNRYDWIFCNHQGIMAFQYSIGWVGQISDPRDAKDSLERFWVLDISYFSSLFPMSIALPDRRVEIERKQNDAVRVQSDSNYNFTYGDTTRYDELKPEQFFLERNPFTYMAKRNRIMDSLGIISIAPQFGTNMVLIAISPRQEYLFHRPDRVIGDSRQIDYLDSVLAIGQKVDRNWTYFTGPLKNNKSKK